MAAGEAHAVRAGRRQETRGRRGRAAARKRAHLRDREAQRAQARRRPDDAREAALRSLLETRGRV